MNRNFLASGLLLIVSTAVFAQNPTVTPANAARLNRAARFADTAVENRLVLLALSGPEYDASFHENKINELKLKQAKATWLNLLSLSTQLNDQSFKQTQVIGQTAYVYPKYFFGVTIPLGIIFSQGSTVKMAKESILLSKDQQQQQAAQIRANVLSKYKQFKLDEDLIEMESELLNDVLAMSTQTEESFKNGSITVDIYIGAQRSKNEEMVKLRTLQLQQDLVQIEIERMIGVPLGDVIRPKPVTPDPTNKPKK